MLDFEKQYIEVTMMHPGSVIVVTLPILSEGREEGNRESPIRVVSSVSLENVSICLIQ